MLQFGFLGFIENHSRSGMNMKVDEKDEMHIYMRITCQNSTRYNNAATLPRHTNFLLNHSRTFLSLIYYDSCHGIRFNNATPIKFASKNTIKIKDNNTNLIKKLKNSPEVHRDQRVHLLQVHPLSPIHLLDQEGHHCLHLHQQP